VDTILVSFNAPGLSQAEVFDRLLRKAAARCWLERFRSEAAKGIIAVSYHQIGETAGAVWNALAKDGPLTFAALMEEVNAPQSIFFMAIGWLLREHKLQFESVDGDYLVRLA
jgi:Winged helix-turn-helix domain (DUF2582)